MVRQFQSETDAIREAPEPWGARATLYVLLAFLLSGVALLFLGRIDRVISGSGKIVSTQNVTVFQALDPSIIRTLDVKEGDVVQTGQLLATLDATFAAADVRQLKQQISSLDAQIARASAELSGSEPPVFPHADDAESAKYIMLQKGLYEQRKAQFNAQLNSFDAKIKLAQATITKLQSDEERYSQRQQVAEKIEAMRTSLVETGSGSKLNMFISQDANLELGRLVENTKNGLIEARQTLASNTADREAFIQQWKTTTGEELVKARNDHDTAQAQLEKALKHQDLIRLTAPAPSMVLSQAKLSVGSVLKQGDALFTLMPLNTPVEAEVRILSRDVGFVRTDDSCTIKIDAFKYIEHGMAYGKIRWISDGAFTTDDNGQPTEAYYKARCSITETNFYHVPQNFRLIPGMTLTADVNLGQRSAAMYLLSGLLRGVNEAMREP
ncbi:MAG: HlyD family type I secretion periplasmic adaptor subunit [Xanthobacteraceae bacterium]|nr:HlyD family type I secretion periplasmic adaptor subunit [Xanthobacteraceae bacterium]